MRVRTEGKMGSKTGTIDILHKISAEFLHPKYYFQSLIEQAVSCGLLTDRDLSAMQMELMMLLAEQTDQWSHGESSSIPTEKAQDMIASVMFVLGIRLKTYETPEQAVDRLKSEPLKSLFESGLKLVRSKMAGSRRLQKQIADILLDTPNVYYRSTVVDGINGFFKLYRPQFTAHEIHITADYPVLAGRPELNGIEFIEQYLRCIDAENAFCRCFAAEDIHHLLCGLTPDYPKIPMNLLEPVLLSALGLILANRNPAKLDLQEKDICLLQQQFSGQSVHEIQDSLERALLVLDWKIKLPQIAIQYASFCILRLAVTVQNAVKTKTLDKVFLIPAYPEQDFQITISYGDRMDDRKYRKLVQQILQTDSSKEKVELILQEVHSLADLLDIMSDTELYAEELALIVNLLPLSAFAALLSQYPNDDFLINEHEQLLYEALQKRKQQLLAEEMQQVEQALGAIQKEDL